jgi:hypothetical protein
MRSIVMCLLVAGAAGCAGAHGGHATPAPRETPRAFPEATPATQLYDGACDARPATTKKANTRLLRSRMNGDAAPRGQSDELADDLHCNQALVASLSVPVEQ